MANGAGDITLLLEEWREHGTSDELFRRVFESCRHIAEGQLRGERAGHTLQPTALVNEAWLRLSGGRPHFANRSHFFAVAAKAMRQILVDHARHKRANKRIAPELHEEPTVAALEVDVLALDSALTRLAALDEAQARVVELKYFAGLTNEEVAEVQGQSLATVKRSWQAARAFLFRELDGR